MIRKSYLVEENIEVLKKNLVLFYGENVGLIEELKKKIINRNNKVKVIKFSQEDILKNNNIYFDEIRNKSLFDKKKIIFIHNASDKLLDIIKESLSYINENNVFIFSNILEKKSKLRNFFEKDTESEVVPCYNDNEISIKTKILQEFKNYKWITPQIINLIVESCGNDRIKLMNEITKIKTCFDKETIKNEDLVNLLNLNVSTDFNILKDASIAGNKQKTNQLLNSTIIEIEKLSLYTSAFNQRLTKLKIIKENSKENLDTALANMKPPIFWKDKPIYLNQLKSWNSKKLTKALDITYNMELKIKSFSYINKELVLKKFILDICNLANAA